jgi:tetratricopeptide (TPR) repeat protein
MNKLEEAIGDFTTAVDLEPSNHINYYWRALASLKAGKWSGAISDLDVGLEKCGDVPATIVFSQFWKGIIKEKQGLKEEAEALYKEALKQVGNIEDLQTKARIEALIKLITEEPEAARLNYEKALIEKPLRHQNYATKLYLQILTDLFPERADIKETYQWFQQKLGPLPQLPEDSREKGPNEIST